MDGGQGCGPFAEKRDPAEILGADMVLGRPTDVLGTCDLEGGKQRLG